MENKMSIKPSATAPERNSRREATPNRNEIEERAYFRYVERGRADGEATDDWLVAETELREKASSRADS